MCGRPADFGFMQFLTKQECEQWLSRRGREAPSKENSKFSGRAWFSREEAGRLYYLSRQIAAAMMEARRPCLLWIQETDIWEANLHLYYRLRQSYGNCRLVEDAPGHEFLGYEMEDLATLLQVSLLNGWGGLILTHFDDINAFFSHDGFIDFYAGHESTIKDLLKAFKT
jgi:hypothetical protein